MPGCRRRALESVGEIAGVEAAQAGRDPGREMHAVCDIADVEFVLEVTRPHVAQDLLRHLAVEPRHPVDLLREVAGQHRHRELFIGVVGVGLAQVDVLLPGDAQHVGVVRHVLADHRLGEGVVPGGHGGMRCEERRRADHLQRLREGELLWFTRSRMRSMPMNAACPSLQWNTSCLMPNARSARIPPIPSRISCLSRFSQSPP